MFLFGLVVLVVAVVGVFHGKEAAALSAGTASTTTYEARFTRAGFTRQVWTPQNALSRFPNKRMIGTTTATASILQHKGAKQKDDDDDDSAVRSSNNTSPVDWRLYIFLIGTGVGYAMILPNFILCDSGTAGAHMAARIGLTASALFITGGFYGLVSNKWSALLPGVWCQVAAMCCGDLVAWIWRIVGPFVLSIARVFRQN